MSISNINPGVSYAQPPELPAQARERQRAVAEKLISSLPGNSRRSSPQAPNIHKIATDIAQVGQAFNKKLHFIVDPRSNEVIVKVIDKTTDKVIKVLPPEELQRLHRKLKETIGFLFNEQV